MIWIELAITIVMSIVTAWLTASITVKIKLKKTTADHGSIAAGGNASKYDDSNNKTAAVMIGGNARVGGNSQVIGHTNVNPTQVFVNTPEKKEI